jgi:hypothetical protein
VLITQDPGVWADAVLRFGLRMAVEWPAGIGSSNELAVEACCGDRLPLLVALDPGHYV